MDFVEHELIGKTVLLNPISKHGKDRVHQFGRQWLVDGFSHTVLFSSEKGPFIRLKSNCQKDTRWVKINNDKDFEIVF